MQKHKKKRVCRVIVTVMLTIMAAASLSGCAKEKQMAVSHWGQQRMRF